MWLVMHGLSFKPKPQTKFGWRLRVPFMHGPLPEATQSTTIHIKFVQSVSNLPSSVEAQTITKHASTSVVSLQVPDTALLTVALHRPSCASQYIDLHEIFECSHLKCTVCGWFKQAYIHTRLWNAVTLVWDSLRLTPTIYRAGTCSISCTRPDNVPTVHVIT